MTIILDFDDVLFDAAHFKKALAAIFKKHKVDFWETYNRAKNLKGVFSLGSHLALVKKENKRVDIEKIEKDIDELFEKLQDFLFHDVIKFLKKFRDEDLILLSWGEKRFQKKKIYSLGAAFVSLFDKIVIGPVEKAKALDKILKLYRSKPVIFIDNSLQELESIRGKFKDIILIRITRDTGQDLKKAEKIIKTY